MERQHVLRRPTIVSRPKRIAKLRQAPFLMVIQEMFLELSNEYEHGVEKMLASLEVCLCTRYASLEAIYIVEDE